MTYEKLEHERACAAALTELPKMTPHLLSKMLRNQSAVEQWESLCRSDVRPELLKAIPEEKLKVWFGRSRRTDLDVVASRYGAAGVQVVTRSSGMPSRLALDPQGPAVLFVKGRIETVDQLPTAGIIGTRRCSYEGRTIAKRLGKELSEAGAGVVSGLALGIDGAAHEGVLEADPSKAIAVVGSGLDVVYPKRHRKLWDDIGASGVLISEAPLGASPEAWRFPARNRIIAALSDAVVVVESGESGGSLLTAMEADSRGVPLLAAPGSLFNKASSGTNMLLESRAATWFRSSADVLGIIGPAGSLSSNAPTEASRTRRDLGVTDSELELLDLMTAQPASLEQLALRLGASPTDVVLCLRRLETKRLVDNQGGFWQRLVV